MSSDERMLARAREVWIADGLREAEARRGAARVARRLRSDVRRAPWRTTWTAAGSMAALIATLAYAGHAHRDWIREAASVAQRMRVGANAASASPFPAHGDNVSSNANAQPRAEMAASSDGLPNGARQQQAAAHSHKRTVAKSSFAESASSANDDASWRAVSDALTAGRLSVAENILTRLASQARDGDTRAKAKLGLAQLEAARGRCDKARQLALEVAALTTIDTKTVRRALELATRCVR